MSFVGENITSDEKMSYRVATQGIDSRIAVVGCGGTGAFVADGLCRLLLDRPTPLFLVDHDRVEPHNLRRQWFYKQDVEKFKSQALAERLSRLYGREIAYSVYPYSTELHREVFGYSRDGLVIGCVDNAAARQTLADVVDYSSGQWWLDAGNGEYSGQVLIGNTRKAEYLKSSFFEEEQTCSHLPLPSWQQPALLIPAPEPVSLDCAEAMDTGQSPTINQAMATLTLEFVSRLLGGTLGWMGVYLDLEAGTLRPVPVEPKVVARMVGIRVTDLIAKKKMPPVCPNCHQRHW